MRYFALATDYDGTLAHDGLMSHETVAALEQLRATGRKLILVTGRELEDLLRVLPQIELFDRVVAENGALIYTPATREVHPLVETELIEEEHLVTTFLTCPSAVGAGASSLPVEWVYAP